jgi:glyoxylase-like metal-dependent hydrolase (beta-lactamase superfamily II)
VSRIALVRAPNPSVMTLTGTNSYVIDAGSGEALVIDPGPPMQRHVDALLEYVRARGLRVSAIALTHGHPDHAPAAAPLARATGALVYAHPNSEVPHDRDFDLGGELRVGTLALRVLDAPGHTFEHAVFYEAEERALFTGDVILGEGTVVIAPPGGAMRPYQETLARIGERFSQAAHIYGGHGPRVDDAPAKIAEYIEHRKLREAEVRRALESGPKTIPQLVLAIYGEDRPMLHPAMARQMLAYLLALVQEGAVTATPAGREMTPQETAMLNPSWVSIVGAEHAPFIEAELGAMLKLDVLYVYRAN